MTIPDVSVSYSPSGVAVNAISVRGKGSYTGMTCGVMSANLLTLVDEVSNYIGGVWGSENL